MIWSENFGEIGYHFENRDSQGEKRGVAPLYPYPARRRQQNPIFHARNNWNSSEETTGFVIGARAILSFSPLLLLPVLICLSLSLVSRRRRGEKRNGREGARCASRYVYVLRARGPLRELARGWPTGTDWTREPRSPRPRATSHWPTHDLDRAARPLPSPPPTSAFCVTGPATALAYPLHSCLLSFPPLLPPSRVFLQLSYLSLERESFENFGRIISGWNPFLTWGRFWEKYDEKIVSHSLKFIRARKRRRFVSRGTLRGWTDIDRWERGRKRERDELMVASE